MLAVCHELHVTVIDIPENHHEPVKAIGETNTLSGQIQSFSTKYCFLQHNWNCIQTYKLVENGSHFKACRNLALVKKVEIRFNANVR